jgi:hypothetical protein
MGFALTQKTGRSERCIACAGYAQARIQTHLDIPAHSHTATSEGDERWSHYA